MKKIFKIFKAFIWTALVLFFFLIAATFLPIPGNYKAYTVQSGSMEPKIKLGSLIFSKPSANYNVGDIITIRIDKKNTVTHRIVEKKGNGNFATKGDANEDPDPEEAQKENIIGKTFFILPYAGFPIAYAKTKLGFILLILIPSVIIIYEELRKIGMEIKSKFEKYGTKKTEEKEKIIQRSERDNSWIAEMHESLPRTGGAFRPKTENPPPRRKIV